MKFFCAARLLGLLAGAMLLPTSLLFGATYYVDSQDGNDSNVPQ